jgi:hypothetical protein
MTKLLTAFAFIIVLFATCHYAKADGFYAAHWMTVAGYNSRFSINFNDKSTYPFANKHGGSFSEKDYGLNMLETHQCITSI